MGDAQDGLDERSYPREASLWKRLGNEIIIVDSTACISKYMHVLYTIVSVDKANKGHVLAWLVVEAESKDAITPLLEVLKERCGETKPRLFVSDDAMALWNSWLVTFQTHPFSNS